MKYPGLRYHVPERKMGNREMSSNEKVVKDIRERIGFAGVSEKFLQIIGTITQVAPTDISVLITGESGSGKEMIAKAIHLYSSRNDKQMISVNCGAIPEGILESELFGHEKGAFTGATGQRKGYFEIAHDGTIFLDEIGEMSLYTQVKFLRVLEEREFLRVGGTQPIKVNSRIIAATNKNLEKAVEKKEFRKDLYYRLKAVTIEVPPLRERVEDIEVLAKIFIKELAEKMGIDDIGITPEAIKAMMNYEWPGNVRELKNLMESLIILNKGKDIDIKDLPENFQETVESSPYLPIPLHKSSDQAEREVIYRTLLAIAAEIADIKRILIDNFPKFPKYLPNSYGRDTRASVEEVITLENDGESELSLKNTERDMIRKALEKYKGNRRKAAKDLGISERTLYRKVKEQNL